MQVRRYIVNLNVDHHADAPTKLPARAHGRNDPRGKDAPNYWPIQRVGVIGAVSVLGGLQSSVLSCVLPGSDDPRLAV